MAQDQAAAFTIIVFGVLVFLFYGPWQWVCTDWIRQICFEARDELFDLAADGRLDFQSSEYKEMRRTIEGEIRFAHDMTLPYIVLLGTYLRYAKPDLMEAARRADTDMKSNIVDASTRQAVETIIATMNARVLVFVMLKSPLLLALPVLIVAPLAFCLSAVKANARLTAKLANSLIRAAAYICDRSGDDFHDHATV